VVGDTIRLAVDMGRSAVKDQADQLNDLRSRAGTLLAAAAIALIAYLCCVGACIYVLLPHELSIEFRGTVLLKSRDEVGASDEEAHEAVVQWLENVRADNSGKLRKLKEWYTAAAIALGAEVAFWILTLAT
jgi:hypothetical protein